MAKILKQQYDITNPFDEQMAILALKEQVSSTVFKELIQKEKEKITITFLIEVSE